jgi:hypothetical protein
MEKSRYLPLGGKGRHVTQLQKEMLLGCQQRGDLLWRPAVNSPLAVEQDRVVAGRLDARLDHDLPPLVGRHVPVIRQHDGPDARLGLLHGADRCRVAGDLVEGIGGAGRRMDDDGAVHTVLELAALVGVVPVRAGLRGFPPVDKARPGLDLPLGEARHAVRPGCVEHLDACTVSRQPLFLSLSLSLSATCGLPTVIVHRRIEGHLVVHRHRDVVPVVDLEQGPGKLAIGQDHLPLEAVGRMLLPRQGQVEGPRLAVVVMQRPGVGYRQQRWGGPGERNKTLLEPHCAME